jgi:hypothetical protein
VDLTVDLDAITDPAERARAMERRRKARRRKRGLCSDCSKKARPGKSNCEECAEKKRITQRALCIPRIATPEQRRRSKKRRRERGLCNDCSEKAMRNSSRCAFCAATHRKRERFAIKYGRPAYLAHLHEELPIWQRALLARGQFSHLRKVLKKAS